MNEDYPVKSPYFSEVYGSLQSRPEDFMSKSQYREGNTEYLTDSRETDLNDPMTVNMARVREYATHPPRREREDYFPEVLWDMNRLTQTHQKPAGNRVQDVSQASLRRSAEVDVPGKRMR